MKNRGCSGFLNTISIRNYSFVSRIMPKVNNSSSFEEQEQLIDLIEPFPHLYAKGAAEYHDINMKNNSWVVISEKMNMNGKKGRPL